MSTNYPKDGSTFVTETIERTAYRWAKYKPDGARQMGKPGRWQKQVWIGDWFKWENCDEPTGEISPPIEDGPISRAFKQAGSLEHWRQEVGKLHSQIAAKDAALAYHASALAEKDARIAELEAALADCEQKAEDIRKVLIRQLHEPERSAFWKAVAIRNRASAALAKEKADA